MVTGRLDIYKYDRANGDWSLFKSNVSLSRADQTIKHSSLRLVCVSNGIVIAATDGEDLDLVFDDVETIRMAG